VRWKTKSIQTIPTQLMSLGWPSQNTFGMYNIQGDQKVSVHLCDEKFSLFEQSSHSWWFEDGHHRIHSQCIIYRVIKKSLCTCAMKNSVYSNNPHTIDELKMAITEYIRNVQYTGWSKSLCAPVRWKIQSIRTILTQFISWRWPSQNTFGMCTMSSRTQFSVSIFVWRDTLNIPSNFLYCNHQVHRDSLITLYKC
jgi:hypothetical protein